MGKVRVKTIGIEEEEDKEKKKLQARNDAKKAEAAKKRAEKEAKEPTSKEPKQEESKTAEEVTEKSTDEKKDKKPKKSKYKDAKKKKNPHSANYLETAKLVDRNKKYTVDEALKILQKSKSKFDETVELHINTNEKGVSGNMTLPHGTGKKMRVEIADNVQDPKHLSELVKEIESGKVNFDILIATPDSMSHLAKIARILGPKGLMPNPKNGTIHPKPKEAMKKFEGGQINFKTEAKAPIIHMSVGKLSFEEKQLTDNIKATLQAVKAINIKNVTIKSTMSPGIKIAI